MATFQTLPTDLQTEVLSFLSLKHLGTILSISPSIKELVEESDLFWDQLYGNYCKYIGTELESEFTSESKLDMPSRISKLNTHFPELIKKKKIKIENISLQIATLQKTRELQSQKQKLLNMRLKLETLRLRAVNTVLNGNSGAEVEEKKDDNDNSEDEKLKQQIHALEKTLIDLKYLY